MGARNRAHGNRQTSESGSNDPADTGHAMKIGSRPIDMANYLVEQTREDGAFSKENNRFNWRFDQYVQICSQINFVADGKRIRPKIDLPLKWNSRAAQKVIRQARAGDRQADQVLCDIASELLERSVDLPPELRGYVVNLLRTGAELLRKRRSPPLKKRKNPHSTFLRDAMIIAIVDRVARHKKLKATRSPASEHDSACSVVAKAAGMKEDTVNKIWGRGGKILEK
jgi:hypothetical protein